MKQMNKHAARILLATRQNEAAEAAPSNVLGVYLDDGRRLVIWSTPPPRTSALSLRRRRRAFRVQLAEGRKYRRHARPRERRERQLTKPAAEGARLRAQQAMTRRRDAEDTWPVCNFQLLKTLNTRRQRNGRVSHTTYDVHVLIKLY